MTEQRTNTSQSVFKHYLMEIVVIFIGISISFWFEEWREDRNDRKTEREILLSLKANLAQDTFMLGGTAKMGEDLVRGINKLIVFKRDAEIADSVSFFIDMGASYLGCQTNQTTYEEIKQTGHTRLIQDDTLKRAILGHYTSIIPYAKEWTEIDKIHIMSYLIPEMSNYFPVVMDTLNMVSNMQKVKYLKTPKLRHLLLTNVTYKKEAIKALNMANAQSKKLIARIDRVLKNK